MHAVDTNVLVRFLATDNPEQCAKARDFILNHEVVVSTTVLLEAAWVLCDAFGFSQSQVVDAFRVLGGSPGVDFQESERVMKALDWADNGLDIADAIHLTATPHCVLATFDRSLAKRAGAMVQLL